MIARHVGKTPQAVTRALKVTGMHPGRQPGVKGLRLSAKQADAFVSRQWPEAPSIKQEPTL
jgi:hypothetical protein